MDTKLQTDQLRKDLRVLATMVKNWRTKYGDLRFSQWLSNLNPPNEIFFHIEDDILEQRILQDLDRIENLVTHNICGFEFSAKDLERAPVGLPWNIFCEILTEIKENGFCSTETNEKYQARCFVNYFQRLDKLFAVEEKDGKTIFKSKEW